MVSYKISKFKPNQLWINESGKFLIINVVNDLVEIYYYNQNHYRLWVYDKLEWLTEQDEYLGEISSLERELL